ncbi:MAG: hypothetical protein QNJ98_02585 [Planctomycetota bacterium]|nr:hypothetical protein [Planctomycetota bacterium]
MDEQALVAGFEDTTLPLAAWNHRAHLTVAWTYLERHGLDDATGRMRDGIRRYNQAHDLPDELDRGYHETLTQAWLRVLDGVRRIHGAGDSATAFLEAQPYLLNRLLLRLYYSREQMMSWEAKRTYVPPDLAPFPAVPEGDA